MLCCGFRFWLVIRDVGDAMVSTKTRFVNLARDVW